MTPLQILARLTPKAALVAAFLFALYLAADWAVRTFPWAAELAWSLGFISEDDLGDER